jgi:hypothetical protein
MVRKRNRRHTALGETVAVIIIVTAVVLYFMFRENFAAAIVGVVGVALGVAALIVGLIPLFSPPPTATAKAQTDEDKLAALVLIQAQKKRSQLIGIDIPGDATANGKYASIPGRINKPDGREMGDLHSILYFQSLSPQRLVIIGAPGAGKTVLLLELQVLLLEERYKKPDTPIPLLVSASAYDATQKWEDERAVGAPGGGVVLAVG